MKELIENIIEWNNTWKIYDSNPGKISKPQSIDELEKSLNKKYKIEKTDTEEKLGKLAGTNQSTKSIDPYFRQTILSQAISISKSQEDTSIEKIRSNYIELLKLIITNEIN